MEEAVDEPVIQQTSKPKVVLFGDSISSVVGYGQDSQADNRFGNSVADVVSSYLGVPVDSQAMGGVTTKDALTGSPIPFGGQNLAIPYGTYEKYLQEQRPNVVILRFGAADAIRLNDPQQTVSNLQKMLDLAKKYGATPVLIGVSPFAAGGDSRAGNINAGSIDPYIASANQINAGIQQLAQQNQLPFVDMQRLQVPQGALLDGVHPTAEFGKQMADYIGQAVTAALPEFGGSTEKYEQFVQSEPTPTTKPLAATEQAATGVRSDETAVRASDWTANLPANWGSFTGEEKVQYFNQQGITPEQLAPYATPEQIQYFQDKMGYTVGKPAAVSSSGSASFDPATLGSAQKYYSEPDLSYDAYQEAINQFELQREGLVEYTGDRFDRPTRELNPGTYEEWVSQQYTRAAEAARKGEADVIEGRLVQQLLAGWQGLGEEVGIGSSGTPEAEIGGRRLGAVAQDFARRLREKGITDITQAKFDPGALAAWTAEGKGNVSLLATPDGRLIPVWGSSSDAAAVRGAALSLALSFTGAGALIGSTITTSLGIAASAATNALIGNVVVNTALNGGDIGAAVKGAVASWAGAQVGGMVGNAAKTVFDSAEGVKLISNIANNATQAAIRGGDVESAILNTFVAGAVDFATAKIPEFDKLPSSVQSTIKQSINAAVQGKDIDAGAMLANAAKEGLLSYGLSQIPQFNEADARTQSFVTTMLRSAIDGGDLSESAVKWAVGQAQQEFQKVIKAGPALDELKKAGIISEASYFGLTDEQKELVDRFAAQKDPKAAAAKYINEQTTTPEEIRQFYKQITGKDATDEEAELLSTFTGMDEETAKVGLDNQIRANIAADELRFEELNKVFTDPKATDQDLINTMAEYKITPAFIEKITGKKYDDVVRQLSARFMTQDEVTKAFKDAREAAGLEPRDPTPDELLRYTGKDANAVAQIQADVDREATTFDGSTFGSVKSAMEAAKAQGYNNFTGPDGKSYMVHSPVVAIQAGAFDGTTFGSVKSASDAAREAGKTTFIGPDEQHYMVLTPAQEGVIKDDIKQTKTFGQAFADARSKLGPGRTFEWTNPATGETKTYNTYTATELYDGSRAGSKTDAAILAAQNGKTMFQYDGKIWSIPPGSLDNVGTQSRAEARRLVEANATAISNEQAAALEKKLQTPKLGDLDTVGGKLANLFGMSMQGLGQQVQMFADAYSAITGTPYGNSYYKIGQAMQGIGDSLTSRSLDKQTAAANKILAQGEKANFLDQPGILAKAIKENPGWFGSQTFQETVQEVAPWAATLLGYGAATAVGVAAAPAMLVGLATGAVSDGLEVLGSGAREAYDILRKAGIPEEEARSAALRNGVMQALVVMPAEFIADKALFKSLFDKLNGGIKAWAMKGLSATSQQTLAEYLETVGQQLSTKINTLDREMTVADLKEIGMQSLFAASLGGSTTASIISGDKVLDSAVVAKDKLGNNVTLQEFLNGSRDVDLNTLNPNAVIGQGTNGQPVRLGSLSAIALQEGFTPATMNEILPSSFTTENNIVLNRDALGNDITLGDVFSGTVDSQQAKTVIQDYVDLGLTAKTPTSKVVSVNPANNTAVVEDQSGNTQTVAAGTNVKAGDTVNVDPNTNTATLAGSTVVSTDTSNNTATVQNQDGTTSTVVTTDPVKVGDQVNTNQDDGTAKSTDTTNAEAKGEAAAQDALVDAGLATDTTQGTAQDQAAGTDQSAVQDQTAGTGAAQTGTQDQSAATDSAATDATQDQTAGTGVTQDQAADTSKSTVVATNTDGTKAIVENSDGTSAIVDTPGGAKVGDAVVVDPTTNTATPVDATANTGTVIATSPDGTAAVVQKTDGSTAVVNTDTTATVGDKVNINPVDSTATVQTGNVTDAVVADVNVTDGTATVITSDGTKAVVDTAGQQVDPGSIVTVDKDTATITTPETSGKYGDNTTAYYMNKQWTAAETEAMPWGQTVVNGQFVRLEQAPKYVQEQSQTTTQQPTTSQDQVVNLSTGIAADTNTGVVTNPNSGVSVDTNTGMATNANTGVAVDTNTGTAVNPNTNTAVDTNTGVATNANTNTAVDTNTGVTTNPNTNTAVDTNTGTAVNANTGVAVDTNTGVATNTNTNTAVDTNTGTAVNPNTNTAVDTNTGTAVNTNTGVAVDTNTGVATNANTNTAVDTNTGVATNANTNTAVDTNTGVATNANTNTAVDTNTGVATNANTNTAVDTNTGVTVNPNTNTAVDTNTGVATTVNPNTNTQTNVDTSTGTATTVDPNTGVQTQVDPNTNTQTTVDPKTNTQTTTDTSTGTQVKTNIEEPKVVEDPRIKQLQDRIDQLIQAGLDQTAATNAAMSELTGQLSTLTQAQAAAEQARQQAAQQAAQQQSIRGALELFAPQTAGKGSNEFLPVSPLQTSGSSKFISPLAAFLATVESQNYAQPKPQQQPMTPQQPQVPDRYAYGKEPSIDELLDPYGERRKEPAMGFKAGGLASPLFAVGGGTRYGKYAKGGLNVVHHSGKARVDFRHGDAVTGPGDGQSDDIPAMLADGEYVIDSEIVAALGNGSTKAGSELLDEFRRHIRSHKRGGSLDEIPPPSKSPLEYLAMAKKSVDKRASKK